MSPAAGPPPLIYGEVSVDTMWTEIHISTTCPNAHPNMWRNAKVAPAGQTGPELAAVLIHQELEERGEASITVKVCRCTVTGEPEPLEEG